MGDHVAAGAEVSAAEVQNLAVSSYLKSNTGNEAGDFSRLIWLSPNFKISDERQQSFLENMRRDLEDVGRTEIFQTPFEDFKFVLKNSLIESGGSEMGVKSHNPQSNSKSIYVIYDKADRDPAGKLIQYLRNKGLAVLEPSFEGNLMDIRQLHLQNLIDFDGVIIYAGVVNPFWVKMKLLDIMKSPGFGRIKTLQHKAVFSETPGKINTGEFQNYEVHILEKSNGGYGQLDSFINKLE
jgi:hypothetical protein